MPTTIYHPPIGGRCDEIQGISSGKAACSPFPYQLQDSESIILEWIYFHKSFKGIICIIVFKVFWGMNLNKLSNQNSLFVIYTVSVPLCSAYSYKIKTHFIMVIYFMLVNGIMLIIFFFTFLPLNLFNIKVFICRKISRKFLLQILCIWRRLLLSTTILTL